LVLKKMIIKRYRCLSLHVLKSLDVQIWNDQVSRTWTQYYRENMPLIYLQGALHVCDEESDLEKELMQTIFYQKWQ
jgi:hypothetical protein